MPLIRIMSRYYRYSKTSLFKSLLTPNTPLSIKNSHTCSKRTLKYVHKQISCLNIATNTWFALRLHPDYQWSLSNVYTLYKRTLSVPKHILNWLCRVCSTNSTCFFFVLPPVVSFKTAINLTIFIIQQSHYQILFLHTINMWSNDSEVLHTLRWTSVGYINCDFNVVAYITDPAFKWTRKARLWKRKFKWEFVCSTWKYWDCAFYVLLAPNDLAFIDEILVVFHCSTITRHQHFPFYVGFTTQKSTNHY